MTADACATPGCGHPKRDHEYVVKEVTACFRACGCTAYLPPRPVPEEAAPTSNTRRCAYCKDPMVLGKRVCRCGSSVWEWIDPTMTDERMKAAVIENATTPASVPAPHAEAEAGEVAEEAEAWHQWVLDEEPALPPEWWDITRRAVAAGFKAGRGRGDRGVDHDH